MRAPHSPAPLAETCEVAANQRKNCGFSGITPSQCTEKGCCFDSSVPGYPWCFYPTALHDKLPEEGMSATTLGSEDVEMSEQTRRGPRDPALPRQLCFQTE